MKQIFNRMVLAVGLLFAAFMFYGAAHDPWAFAQTIGPPPASGGGGTPGGVTTDIQCNVSGSFNACATTKAQVDSSGIGYFLGGTGSANSLVIGAKTSSGISLIDNGGTLLLQNGDNSGAVGGLTMGSGANFTLGGYIALNNGNSFLVGGTNLVTVGFISGTASGDLLSRSYIAGGSAPTLSGTCTTGSQTGGNTAGTFTATCVSQTVIITFALTAPTGWVCNAHDQSTPTDALNQTSSSTTSCTLSGTTVASDRIQFNAVAY